MNRGNRPLKKGVFSSLLTFSLALLMAPAAAHANPLFAIGEGTGTSWTDAIASGNVAPVTVADGPTAFEVSYFDDIVVVDGLDGWAHQTATLTPDLLVPDAVNEIHQALVMSWPLSGSADPGNNFIDFAAWEYVYDADPDLRGKFLQFSLLRRSVRDVSVELIDAQGQTKSWTKRGASPTWELATLDLSSNVPQIGFDVTIQAGFDLDQVTKIRFDESGIWSGPFPVDPSGNVGAWNAWNSVKVVPEPSALLLLVSVVALGANRRHPGLG